MLNIHPGAGRKTTANQANGLESKVLLLCKGAGVCLTKNVWHSAGLCNGGATGKERFFQQDRYKPFYPAYLEFTTTHSEFFAFPL
jgi:hypothetical protein